MSKSDTPLLLGRDDLANIFNATLAVVDDLIEERDALLAACQKFVDAMRKTDQPEFTKLIEALHDADAAIAKATEVSAEDKIR